MKQVRECCEHVLLHLRKQKSRMSETTDIIVIGGGVMGTSIAYHLSKQGERPGYVTGAESAMQRHDRTFWSHHQATLLK